MLRRPAQIPRSRLEIDFRVEQFLHPEILDAIFLGPFLRRHFAHLHQAAFSGAAELVRIEPAFAPDDRLHQHRIEMMLGRHRPNERVMLLKTPGTDPLLKRVNRIARFDARDRPALAAVASSAQMITLNRNRVMNSGDRP